MKAHWLGEDGSVGASIEAATLAGEGVLYRAIPVEGHEPEVARVMTERGYLTRDEVRLGVETPGLDGILAKFDREHLHEDDEARYVLEGEGIFDIRSHDDRWMRVVVEAGDLIVVPRDRQHRFLLTERRFIRCARLFADVAGWVPHYRSEAAAR